MTDTISIKRQFFDSLKRGTGEAYLIGKKNPTVDFSNYIIKGALKNYAYDGQSENSRAQYIFDLISTSTKKVKIRNAILKGIQTEDKDTWSLTQLFELAKLYALQGDREMRQAIHLRFFENTIEGSDWVGYEEILELGGFTGLLFIAHKIGAFLEKNPDDRQDNTFIDHFQNDHPEIDAVKELRKISKSNSYIKNYLDNIKRTEKLRKAYKRPVVTINTLLDHIEKSEYTFIPPALTKNLNEKELKEFADKFLNENNLIKKEKYLSIFTNRKFPYDYQPILELAIRKPTSKNRLTEYAVDALQHIKSKDIRLFAIEKLKSAKSPDIYTNLLISNYTKGDSRLLKEIAAKSKNEFIIESLARSYADIFTTNKTKECLAPLLELYNKMNCGIHRNSIVELLIENKVLPDKLNAEIKHDSYAPTRLLYRKKKNVR